MSTYLRDTALVNAIDEQNGFPVGTADVGVLTPQLKSKYDRLHPMAASLFLIINPGGGVGEVPTPQCVEAHLPKGRKPTPAEIRAAWKACEGSVI
jgi:hypothetical protein